MLEDDYRALIGGAAITAVAPRGRIAVSGRDRASYLQGLLTNYIPALQPGTGCYAAWLTPQGRMTTDMHVLESGDMMLLDVPGSQTDELLQRLDMFIFTEDVQVANLTEPLRGVGVHGPAAAAVIAQVIGLEGLSDWREYRNERVAYNGTPIVVARIDQLGVPGFTLYVEAARAAELVSELERAGAVHVAEPAVTAARVEAGYPLFPADMNDDIIPLEAGIEGRAISFSKGCYVGQEVVIRVLHRGHGRVVRKLVGLRLEGDELPAPLARLHAGDREIGFVTSVARSPRLGAIALGYVHRDFLAPGSRVEVDASGGRVAATVSALPFATEA